MDRFFHDLKYAGRVLWRDRGFAATVILTLAVCIGANAAIFAIINGVLLRPLPIPESDRIVALYNSYPKAGVERASSGVPDYYDRRRETDAFEELALYRLNGQTIGGQNEPQRLTGMAVTPSLFRMVKATPHRGRVFREDEGEIGREHEVILSYALWQQLFSGQDSAVGRDLRINGENHTIIGVMPQSFFFMDPDVKLWTPLAFTPQQKSDDARHNNSWTMAGRLKPGVSVGIAQQQVDALNARNLDRFPAFKQILINAGFHTIVAPLQQDLVREVRPTLLMLWAGVLFVLAIGAVNITNLVLIRSSARMRELATRHALGASLPRLMRHLLTETVFLTTVGGALGLIVGYAALRALGSVGLDALPRAHEITIDIKVMGFALSLALLVGLAVGLAPVARLTALNLAQAFREEGRSGTSGRGARGVRRLLVASQVAFAFMLLAGAGLLLTSFHRVLAVDPGFDPANVVTARVAPPASRYRDEAAVRALAERFVTAVRSIPGVEHVGISSSIPFGGDYSDSVILAEGYRMAPGESLISPYRVFATPGYFEALDIPVKRGRTFNDSDTATSPGVVIIDERLAHRFWPGADPVGRRMYQPENPNDLVTPDKNTRYLTVVGVVGETRMAGLATTEDRVGAYYLPFTQFGRRALTLTVRTTGDPLAVAPSIRQQLRALDPELPLYSVRTMADRMNESLADRRTPMVVAIVFAVVALFLAAIGLYGVLAYQVSQRTREIGIRLALGSDSRRVFGLIVKEGMGLLAGGYVAGLGGAFVIRRTMAAQLYGVGPMDPVVLGSVAAVLALVTFVACTLPARRAARIDPIVALSEQ
ncbi:MAG TPA: ABC transporter permease [Vicinamibacterales bacterium]|nr:ABC transporter permease [Vicinamibacterales bacterium]